MLLAQSPPSSNTLVVVLAVVAGILMIPKLWFEMRVARLKLQQEQRAMREAAEQSAKPPKDTPKEERPKSFRAFTKMDVFNLVLYAAILVRLVSLQSFSREVVVGLFVLNFNITLFVATKLYIRAMNALTEQTRQQFEYSSELSGRILALWESLADRSEAETSHLEITKTLTHAVKDLQQRSGAWGPQSDAEIAD